MDGITGIDWQVRPLAGALGAEVLGCDLRALDEAAFAAVADRDNVQLVDRLLRAAKGDGCRRFVFVSAIGVYDGAPHTWRLATHGS